MSTSDTKDKEPKAMTAAEAASKVFRVVPVLDEKKAPVLDKDNQPKMRKQSISEDEVLNFADYGTHVVVVTKSGEKLSSAA